MCRNHRGLHIYLNEVFLVFFSCICMIRLLNPSDVREPSDVSICFRFLHENNITLVCNSSCYCNWNESFTIDCSVIVRSACWNTSWMWHTWDNEANSDLHFGFCRIGVMELWTAVKFEFYKMKESRFLYCHVTVNKSRRA